MESNINIIIEQIRQIQTPTIEDIQLILAKNPDEKGKVPSKGQVLAYIKDKNIKLTTEQLKALRMKHTRTLSGVTPVTVLTKPFPCPGKCIFCPNDVRMPKSYLMNEPGAQRAFANNFDPYFQTYNRLVAYKNIGHPTDKIELIVLGGTWSVYPETYQIWFIKRCFDAFNDFGANDSAEMLQPTAETPIDEKLLEEINGEIFNKSYNQVIAKALNTKLATALKETATWGDLFDAQKQNEQAKCRCIGLSLETRPDEIDEIEVERIRKLGATKVQIGIQSLQDTVLKLNKRGHDVKKTRLAINLLRQAGFKIHAHWMPNLYGSNPKKDMKDFNNLFKDASIKPDELKVYPCSLIQSAELMKFYKDGKWKPYTHEDLLKVLSHVFTHTPRYCRLTRVIRDIPSTDIVTGNMATNFRQIAEKNVISKKARMLDIRSREIKNETISANDLKIKLTKYKTKVSTEYFLEYVTNEDKIAAFLRLALPKSKSFLDELGSNAIIREVHVYGQSIEIGEKPEPGAQHLGLGKSLISKACELAKKHKYKNISVISSIGTREYYKKLGFQLGTLYQTKQTTE